MTDFRRFCCSSCFFLAARSRTEGSEGMAVSSSTFPMSKSNSPPPFSPLSASPFSLSFSPFSAEEEEALGGLLGGLFGDPSFEFFFEDAASSFPFFFSSDCFSSSSSSSL